jgi:hypothetical protein
MPVGGWDTAPPCIQHGVPGSDGVFKPYENCSDFFTFGPGAEAHTLATGVANGYWVLVAIAFIVSLVALAGWVWLEDQKLRRQRDALLLRPGPAAGRQTE